MSTIAPVNSRQGYRLLCLFGANFKYNLKIVPGCMCDLLFWHNNQAESIDEHLTAVVFKLCVEPVLSAPRKFQWSDR